MKLSKLSCAVLSVIALSACGGGGGSSGSHNNQVEPQPEPQPQPQPIEEAGVVVQDFQFNAFSSLDAAEVVTGGNFDSNSKTTVCLDLSHDNSCQDEQYSVSGTGLSFSNKLEWPEDLDVSGMNIIADNNNFVYSIPADSGINGVAVQGTSVQKRIKVYINPASNALHADKLGKDVILGGYTGAKYSSNDFSAQKDYSALDQEIITFADTLVSVLNYSNKEKLAYTEVRDIVSGALQKIIDTLKDLSVSPVQIVVSVDTHNDYNHLANNVNPDPEIPVTNNPPVADFNFEVTADGVVNFSNNSSDPENDKLAYKWKFGDNAESDEASPTHKYKNNGKYTVYLNVTDSGNLSNYITKEVNVDSISEGGNDKPETPENPVEENNAPVAYFYYEDTNEGLVTFRNDSSDPDNDKLTYKWNFGDDTVDNESVKESPNHRFMRNGMYTVSLTVTDSRNLSSTFTKDIIVASVSKILLPDEPPAALFIYRDTADGEVAFTNKSSDPDNNKLTYKWNFGDGTESDERSPKHTYKENGTYTVLLTVTDSHNLTSTFTENVLVTSHKIEVTNNRPIADFSFDVDSNGLVRFLNNSSDPDGDNLTFSWVFYDPQTRLSGVVNPVYRFAKNGTYTVQLTATDDGNLVHRIRKTVKVDNVTEEVASFYYEVIPDDSGKVMVYNTSSLKNVKEIKWDFGDGTDPLFGESQIHTYRKPGQYLISAVIYTDDGKHFDTSLYVDVDVTDDTEIDCRNRESTANVDFDIYFGDIPRTFEFVNRSHDEVGPLKYKWKIQSPEGTIFKDGSSFDFVDFKSDEHIVGYDVGIEEPLYYTYKPTVMFKKFDSYSGYRNFTIRLTAYDICGVEKFYEFPVKLKATDANKSSCSGVTRSDDNDKIEYMTCNLTMKD